MPVQSSDGGTLEGAFSRLLDDPANSWARASRRGLRVQAYDYDSALWDGFDVALSNAQFLIFL